MSVPLILLGLTNSSLQRLKMHLHTQGCKECTCKILQAFFFGSSWVRLSLDVLQYMQTTQTWQTNTRPSFWYWLDMQKHTWGFGYLYPDICRISSCFDRPDFRMMGKMLLWNRMKKMTKRTAGDKDTQIDRDLVFHILWILNASRFGEDLASLVRNGEISRVHTAQMLMLKTYDDSYTPIPSIWPG